MRLLPATIAFVFSLSAVVQVAAFKSASVSNSLSIVVSSTDQAALALVPGAGSGNGVAPAAVSNGSLRLDFRKGTGGIGSASLFGIAPARSYTYNKSTVSLVADTYQMRDVFEVKNNDTMACHSVSVWIPGSVPSGFNLTGMYGRTPTQPTATAFWTSASGQTATRFTLQPNGGSVMVDFYWDTATATVSNNFEVRVAATQVACP